jgi:hypothetical protein
MHLTPWTMHRKEANRKSGLVAPIHCRTVAKRAHQHRPSSKEVHVNTPSDRSYPPPGLSVLARQARGRPVSCLAAGNGLCRRFVSVS